jgi:hypothetical protein
LVSLVGSVYRKASTTHRTTQMQNKHTDIHASSEIGADDPQTKTVYALDRAATVIDINKDVPL